MPVRFPVPNTESVGTPSGAGDAGGGSNRKSASTYGVPRQRDGGDLHPFAVAEHRLVGQIEHDRRRPLVDRRCKRSARSPSLVRTGTPRSGISPAASFSAPPISTAATTSCQPRDRATSIPIA